MTAKEREKGIVRAGILGIAANILLAVFKLIAGLAASSIALILDAVNNLSDVLSSLVTVVGIRMAGRPADREHPWGHGRMEYLSAEIVAVAILYAGITSLVEAAERAIHPVVPAYSPLTFIVAGTAVAVKLLLGRYVTKQGAKYASDSLTNAGKDALWDAVITGATLIGAAVYLWRRVNLEAWLGILISLFIIKAGVDMLRQTVSKILGERVDSELSRAVRETVCETEGVIGAYDLVLNGYGPGKWIGSVNVEVPDTWTADRIDTLSREISRRVAAVHGVVLSSVGIYSRNSTDDEAKEMRSRITEAVMAEPYVLQLHGFYFDLADKRVQFDLVVDFLAPDQEAVTRRVLQKVQEMYPEFEISIRHDLDMSD